MPDAGIQQHRDLRVGFDAREGSGQIHEDDLGNIEAQTPTERRHIQAVSIERIGKEANRWEEQLHLGSDPKAQLIYGHDDESRERAIAFIRTVADRVGRRALAEAARVSVRETAAILQGEHQPTARTMAKLARAVQLSEAARQPKVGHD